MVFFLPLLKTTKISVVATKKRRFEEKTPLLFLVRNLFWGGRVMSPFGRAMSLFGRAMSPFGHSMFLLQIGETEKTQETLESRNFCLWRWKHGFWPKSRKKYVPRRRRYIDQGHRFRVTPIVHFHEDLCSKITSADDGPPWSKDFRGFFLTQMDPSFFNKALLKKVTTALMLESSVRAFFPSCLAAANFLSFCDEECLISKAGDWPSKGLTCFRWRHHYQNVDGFVKHMEEFSFHQVELQPLTLLFGYWSEWHLIARDGWHFSLNLTMHFHSSMYNSQFGCQKADMKFLGRDITVLKVKPLRVMPKGLRTTWPLSIALPEIWPNPFNWARFHSLQRKATAHVVPRTYCFLRFAWHVPPFQPLSLAASPLNLLPCKGALHRWLDFLDSLGHIGAHFWGGSFVCECWFWQKIPVVRAESLVAIHYLVMTLLI